jgi:NDP-sugar pyrophosphorylase family protein
VPVLGSAGGPKRAIPLLSNADFQSAGRGTFLIVNGDTLTDVDVQAMVEDHRRAGALVTMAVVPNTEPNKYGGIAFDDNGAFISFVPRGSAQPSWHFVGMQAAEPAAFASAPADVPFEVGKLYPSLAAAHPGSVHAYRTTAGFMDIGTPSDYLDTSLTLAAREGIDLTAEADVSATARVERSVLWDDVIVEDGAMLRECVVADGVRVPADTSWHGVIIRVASGELVPDERRIDGLAIAAL